MKGLNNKEELVKLIKENPELPVVFFTDNEDIAEDYGCTFRTHCSCYVGEVWITDDLVYEDVDSVVDEYRNILCEEEEYYKLEDDEFDKAVEDYVEREIEHYDAIIIWVS